VFGLTVSAVVLHLLLGKNMALKRKASETGSEEMKSHDIKVITLAKKIKFLDKLQ
jgi:hypothetical protein